MRTISFLFLLTFFVGCGEESKPDPCPDRTSRCYMETASCFDDCEQVRVAARGEAFDRARACSAAYESARCDALGVCGVDCSQPDYVACLQCQKAYIIDKIEADAASNPCILISCQDAQTACLGGCPGN